MIEYGQFKVLQNGQLMLLYSKRLFEIEKNKAPLFYSGMKRVEFTKIEKRCFSRKKEFVFNLMTTDSPSKDFPFPSPIGVWIKGEFVGDNKVKLWVA